MGMEVEFEDLESADLIIDCIYKGGAVSNLSAEPFHKLIPGCENAGGFRKKLREDGSGKYAYEALEGRDRTLYGQYGWKSQLSVKDGLCVRSKMICGKPHDGRKGELRIVMMIDRNI